MRIATKIEAAPGPSQVLPTPPEAPRCPFCGSAMGVQARDGALACLAMGRDRLRCEDAGAAAVMLAATAPATASIHIIASPARGPMRVAPQIETVMTEAGPRTRALTRDGFHPVALVDAFDLMEVQARRRDPKAPALFSVRQVEAGREYARLAERCAAEGVRCSSVEALGQGGGTGNGSWIDGVVARGRRLERMRAAIGREVALAPGRRGRPRKGSVLPPEPPPPGVGRTITVRELVDAVCCEGVTLSGLLTARGWTAQAKQRDVLRAHLCGALNRLYGL